jgi:hypothetical protein
MCRTFFRATKHFSLIEKQIKGINVKIKDRSGEKDCSKNFADRPPKDRKI